MKRDLDLVRKILKEIEACDQSYGLLTLPDVDGYDKDTISYHLYLLTNGGLVEAETGSSGHGYDDYTGINLTWDGQDFLSAAKDDSLWAKTKDKFFDGVTGFTFDMVKKWMELQLTQMW